MRKMKKEDLGVIKIIIIMIKGIIVGIEIVHLNLLKSLQALILFLDHPKVGVNQNMRLL